LFIELILHLVYFDVANHQVGVELIFANSYFSEQKFKGFEKCEFNKNFRKKKEQQLYIRSNVYQLRPGAIYGSTIFY
jgi:hypothetical protein